MKNSIINCTNFKISSLDIKKYIDKSIYNIIKENNLDNKDKVIFISSPTTGIDNYQENYNEFKKLVEDRYINEDIFIFCPDYYIKQIPEELNPTHLDKLFYRLRMLNLCDMMYVNDKDYDEWEHSEECLFESLHCAEQNIPMFNYKYLSFTVECYKKES